MARIGERAWLSQTLKKKKERKKEKIPIRWRKRKKEREIYRYLGRRNEKKSALHFLDHAARKTARHPRYV